MSQYVKELAQTHLYTTQINQGNGTAISVHPFQRCRLPSANDRASRVFTCLKVLNQRSTVHAVAGKVGAVRRA